MPSKRPLTIFFSAGEPSGDLHGANLIRRLRERCDGFEAVGYGGPQMAEAGCRLHADLTALAVMWLLRVLLNLHKFWHLVSRANRLMAQHPKLSAKARAVIKGTEANQGTEIWWKETRRLFDEFREALAQHERGEDELLQEAYTQDIGSND